MAPPDSGEWVDESADWKDEPSGGPTPPPAPPRPPGILRRYVDAMGRGSPLGGAIGGIAGGAMAGPLGVAPGAFVGNLMGQGPTLTPEQQGLRPPGLTAMAKGDLSASPSAVPPVEPHSPDYEAAAADAATQGVFAGAMRGAGAGAAKLGFPRVAGVLGAKPPAQAVLDTTSPAVKGVSTPALQAVDAASLAGAPAAKEIAAIASEQARRDAVLATERGISERTMAPIQQRMAGRVPDLADKTKGFVDELRTAVPPEKLDKAFESAPSVAEAASNPTVMGARQGMIQEAVPQTVDNQALKLARRPLAAAEARGVAGPPTQHAADAVGLREMGGNLPMDNSYLTRVVNRVPGVGTAMQALPKGGMSPERVTQSTAAVLGSRGSPTINPELAKILAGGNVYRASPTAQAATLADAEILRRFLGQQKSQ